LVPFSRFRGHYLRIGLCNTSPKNEAKNILVCSFTEVRHTSLAPKSWIGSVHPGSHGTLWSIQWYLNVLLQVTGQSRGLLPIVWMIVGVDQMPAKSLRSDGTLRWVTCKKNGVRQLQGWKNRSWKCQLHIDASCRCCCFLSGGLNLSQDYGVINNDFYYSPTPTPTPLTFRSLKKSCWFSQEGHFRGCCRLLHTDTSEPVVGYRANNMVSLYIFSNDRLIVCCCLLNLSPNAP
jgi:hypothetical protein